MTKLSKTRQSKTTPDNTRQPSKHIRHKTNNQDNTGHTTSKQGKSRQNKTTPENTIQYKATQGETRQDQTKQDVRKQDKPPT